MHYPLPPVGCHHCGVPQLWPVWRYVDRIAGQRCYEPVCSGCAAHQDATFTPEMAVNHALIIVGMYQGMTAARGLR